MSVNAHTMAVRDMLAGAGLRASYEIVGGRHSASGSSLLSWVKARAVGLAVPSAVVRVKFTKIGLRAHVDARRAFPGSYLSAVAD